MVPVRMGSSWGHTKLQPSLTYKGNGLMVLELSLNQVTSQGTEIWVYNLFLIQPQKLCFMTGTSEGSKVEVENCWK